MVGDRFYEQQKKYKPKRRLKKDIIFEFERMIGARVDGLDRLTIKSLDDLTDAVHTAMNRWNVDED